MRTAALSTLGLSVFSVTLSLASGVAAKPASAKADAGKAVPWCSPEVSELSDHTCWFDGGVPADGRRTLVVYLHGAYAATPGFQHLQQKALAIQAKHHSFTLLLPTAPRTPNGYLWPGSQVKQEEHEQAILEGIARSKAELERKQGKRFDETFVVGFSSGAYYASSLAVRSAIDVDGFIVLAGGSSWVRPAAGSNAKRAPVFVGVSAADKQTASHSRAFGGTLAALGWPRRVEERDVGHLVDWGFMARGISWLRSVSPYKPAVKTAALTIE
jgi:predicted esterase